MHRVSYRSFCLFAVIGPQVLDANPFGVSSSPRSRQSAGGAVMPLVVGGFRVRTPRKQIRRYNLAGFGVGRHAARDYLFGRSTLYGDDVLAGVRVQREAVAIPIHFSLHYSGLSASAILEISLLSRCIPEHLGEL